MIDIRFRLPLILNVRENMYSVKITFIMPRRVNNIKHANLNSRKIAYFIKFAKLYTRGNIYIHSNSL